MVEARELAGKRIVTSFPARVFFKKKCSPKVPIIVAFDKVYVDFCLGHYILEKESTVTITI